MIDTVADLIAALSQMPGTTKVRGDYDGMAHEVRVEDGRMRTEPAPPYMLGALELEFFTADKNGTPCVIIAL